MINRDNYFTVKRYLDHKLRVLQNDEKTVHRAWGACKHVLSWLDEMPLGDAMKKNPTLPEFLTTSRKDGKDKFLHPSTQEKILSFARELFVTAKRENPSEYKQITEYWLDTLRINRKNRLVGTHLQRHNFWELADIRKVLTVSGFGLKIERDKAALAFLFLSGMRGGAFASLPVEAVDIERRRVRQLPELGVQTKNSKAAITSLLPIPDLLEVVANWDRRVRKFGGRRAWYSRLDHSGMELAQSDDVGTYAMTGRRSGMYDGIKELCRLAGVEFKSPHKIRHGHGVYGVRKARDMAQLKALSQNMMHANVGITDGIYGNLPEDEVASILSGFTE